MAYDAILNGAKALTFFGGNNPSCWSGSDSQFGWNWSFWQSVLQPVVRQLSATSPLAPALVNAASAPRITTGGSGTQVAMRQGTSVDDLWLIAARNGVGSATVTFKGLPRWAHRGSVYTENRTVTTSKGTLRDHFAQWDVHVYHFVEPLFLGKMTPAKATVGSHVMLQGKGLAAAKGVTFGGAKARFKIVGDGKLVATVPPRARTGPIVVASPLTQVQSKATFAVLPSAETKPRIEGEARVGHRLTATTGTWHGDTPTGYTFQWLACNLHGAGCTAIPRATKQTLKLGATRLGERLRVRVTVHTDSGTAGATSAVTSTVTR